MKDGFYREYRKEVALGPMKTSFCFRIRQLDTTPDGATPVETASGSPQQYADEPLIDVFETENGFAVIVEIPADQEIRVDEAEDGIVIGFTNGLAKHVRIPGKSLYRGMTVKRKSRVLILDFARAM